jgi:tellurite resistance protein TehA-like permease
MTAHTRWTLVAVTSVALFAVALSNEVYDLTSPPGLSWHLLLRKTYSIAAFTLVGYLLRRALAERRRPFSWWACVFAVAFYSAAIEIGQALAGSHEGLVWNALDVACGAIGGLLASLIPIRTRGTAD